MAKKPTQEDLPGFKQNRIPQIERWANKFDAHRETIQGLTDEMKTYEFKLREVMHQNEEQLDKDTDSEGVVTLVYKRADYNIKTKTGKERVNVKIGDKAKGEPADETEELL